MTRHPLLAAAALLALGACSSVPTTVATDAPWSRRIADSFLQRHPGGVTYDSLSPDEKWNYEQGLMLYALLRMTEHSGNPAYADFAEKNLDLYVGEDGSIRTYRMADYNIDNVAPGRALLETGARSGRAKFRLAADTLREQLRGHPRTKEGGFWHKKIYPFQMWLDGLYMAGPFYARYSRLTGDRAGMDDAVRQFIRVASHTRDDRTGLFYHAWDESRQQRWADPVTGRSPHFWGRAMGWYAMALIEVLDEVPAEHPDRAALVEIFRGLAAALVKVQDAGSGMWYQVPDLPGRAGNYLESSASAMFVYSFAKGVRMGYLGPEYLPAARRGFDGLVAHSVVVRGNGLVDLLHVCRGAGLGGTPYRDGSFEYYIGEPQRMNDMKGYGPFLLAAIELERAG